MCRHTDNIRPEIHLAEAGHEAVNWTPVTPGFTEVSLRVP